MAMGGGLMDFVQRFQTLQMQRDTGDELIKDLLIYAERIEVGLRQENTRLQSELTDSRLDLADATKSRRELQQLLQQLESRSTTIAQENQRLKVRDTAHKRLGTPVETFLQSHNPYVIVLIDGDGLFFKESYIRQGLEGGKKAAYELRGAILKECGEHAKEIEVIAKCYANMSGLAKAMRRDGSLGHENDFKDFTLGFTQGKSSFDFIDVGHGKERADNKLKEATRWNLRNFNCQQVILGISHDAGYAPYLDDLFQDGDVRQRVTVIEGYPTVRELAVTGVNILNLNGALFRPDKLVDRTPRDPTPPSAISVGATSVASSNLTPATSTTSTPAQPTPPTMSTYARAITSVSPPPHVLVPIQPRPTNSNNLNNGNHNNNAVRPGPIRPSTWNPGPRGLDPPIQVSQTALDSIKKRKDNNKLCNNHYLRGPCAKGDACCFEHNYKPSKDEINAIAFLTRLNPCANGQDCDVQDCIYGHHCPSVREGQCTHPYCKFQEVDHPPGTKFRTRSYDH